MLILIIWAVIAAACGYIASEKNRSVALWVFAGVLFGIFALAVVLCLPKQETV